MTAPCPSCPFASRKGDFKTGVCQNAMNENYARRLALVTSCSRAIVTRQKAGSK